VNISAIADTGAQSDLWSLEVFLACGFSRDDLRPVNLSLSAANRSPISIEGAFFARFSTAPSDSGVTSCGSIVYVSSSVRAMYLSYEWLLNLGLFPADFSSSNRTQRREWPWRSCHTDQALVCECYEVCLQWLRRPK
jgi:hypothetical protein